MEPLGGELFIDRFFEARRAAQPPRPAPRPAPRAEPAPAAASAPAPPPEPEAPQSADVTDTGKLRAEVDAFMQRDVIESADDVEIQEFLKEKAGFNPDDLD